MVDYSKCTAVGNGRMFRAESNRRIPSTYQARRSSGESCFRWNFWMTEEMTRSIVAAAVNNNNTRGLTDEFP